MSSLRDLKKRFDWSVTLELETPKPLATFGGSITRQLNSHLVASMINISIFTLLKRSLSSRLRAYHFFMTLITFHVQNDQCKTCIPLVGVNLLLYRIKLTAMEKKNPRMNLLRCNNGCDNAITPQAMNFHRLSYNFDKKILCTKFLCPFFITTSNTFACHMFAIKELMHSKLGENAWSFSLKIFQCNNMIRWSRMRKTRTVHSLT